ncbi:aminoglycoside 3'-phosphotransferase [Paenibacillus tarimensis]
MKKAEISFAIETVPLAIRQYLNDAAIYDSSCSENARTLFVKGADKAYLKIAPKGSLEREYKMTAFLSGLHVAPKVIAYETDSEHDFLFTEAISGEDGTSGQHLENPERLARVFGESLRMLHSLPVEGCPFKDRTAEMLNEIKSEDMSLYKLVGFNYSDDVIIHGDYCLPNIIMDNSSFSGFIDLGYGGVGDRHYDLYWGLWTLNYNLKTDKYKDIFIDAYGRSEVDMNKLNYFTQLIALSG